MKTPLTQAGTGPFIATQHALSRRKFLRAEATEFQHVMRTVTRLALSRFDVAFTLTHNRREQLSLPIAVGRLEKETRIARLVGADFITNSLFVEHEQLGLRLEGWIGLPSQARAQADRQYLFVNGRMVRDRLLVNAARLGYQDVMYGGRHPAWLLYLSLDPTQVDVNAHPQKMEVRFRDSRQIHDFVMRAVERRLATTQPGAAWQPRASAGLRQSALVWGELSSDAARSPWRSSSVSRPASLPSSRSSAGLVYPLARSSSATDCA